MDTTILLLVIAGIIAIIGLWAISTYNGLARLYVLTEEAWSSIDIQLKRRYDLIPNLVAVVKQYSIHEQSVLENITKFRAQSMNATGPEGKVAAEGQLAGALKTLFAVTENYPQLHANTNFLALQKDLGAIEHEIQLSRRYYNGTIRNYNGAIIVFPASLIAGMTGMHKKPYFELDNSEERQNVKIQF
ncbi:MAG TPA: LemA family protein [Candidatus Babeliales bacterium]|nr:LemA family protein [Candidatus Babeliales bacterium]